MVMPFKAASEDAETGVPPIDREMDRETPDDVGLPPVSSVCPPGDEWPGELTGEDS